MSIRTATRIAARSAFLIVATSLPFTHTFAGRPTAAATRLPRSARAAPRAVLVPSPFTLPSNAERFGDSNVDFTTALTDFGLGITSTGSVRIEAPLATVWDLITDYERHPELIPNILSTRILRNGPVTELEQVGLLSKKLRLKCDMRLAVREAYHSQLALERVAGHGFLDFKAKYDFRHLPNSHCLLSYNVEAMPCPIFPMPIVHNKIRKEVPRMLSAVRAAAIDRAVEGGVLLGEGTPPQGRSSTV